MQCKKIYEKLQKLCFVKFVKSMTLLYLILKINIIFYNKYKSVMDLTNPANRKLYVDLYILILITWNGIFGFIQVGRV